MKLLFLPAKNNNQLEAGCDKPFGCHVVLFECRRSNTESNSVSAEFLDTFLFTWMGLLLWTLTPAGTCWLTMVLDARSYGRSLLRAPAALLWSPKLAPTDARSCGHLLAYYGHRRSLLRTLALVGPRRLLLRTISLLWASAGLLWSLTLAPTDARSFGHPLAYYGP